MNRRLLGLTLVLLAAAFGVIAAQVPGGPAGGRGSGAASSAAPSQRGSTMAEDVEILRQILDRKLANLSAVPVSFCPATHGRVNLNVHGFGLPDPGGIPGRMLPPGADGPGLIGNTTAPGMGPGGLSHPALFGTANTLRGMGLPVPGNDSVWLRTHSVEGIYLKGQGVVFTASLPIDASAETKEPPAKAERKSLTEWERVRRELTGDAVGEEPRPEPRKPTLADTMLKALADNGHNLADLQENENVTVALFFRPNEAGRGWVHSLLNQQMCAKCHTIPFPSGGGMDLSSPEGAGAGRGAAPQGGESGTGGTPAAGGGGSGPVGLPPGGGGRLAPATGTPDGAGDALGEARNFMLIGDLHMKQGRAKDAVDAYAKAAKSFENFSQSTWTWDQQQILTGHDLYSRLAQAHLANGSMDEARKALEKALKVPSAPKNAWPAGEGAGGGTAGIGSGGGGARPAIPLPPKLIITVSKRSLDQVAAGKLTLDDFKKQATVQRLNFPRPRPPMPGGGAGPGSSDGGAAGGVPGPGGGSAGSPDGAPGPGSSGVPPTRQ